jgi:hypothetical protein
MEPLMISIRRLVSLVVASVACSFPMAADAALLAYDGFDYAPVGSDLLGKSGGFGFSTPWRPGGFNASINTNFDVQNGSLPAGGLITSGNRVQTNAVTAISGLTRDLATPLGVPGTTRYLSFLLRPEGQLHGGAFNGFFGVNLEQPGEPSCSSANPAAAPSTATCWKIAAAGCKLLRARLRKWARQYSSCSRPNLPPATTSSRCM